MLRRAAALSFFVGLLASLHTSASAGEPVCQQYDASTGVCDIWVTEPGGSDGGTTVPTGPAVCTFAGEEIPCSSSQGYWSASYQCYIRQAPTQPPRTDPIWQGRENGAIYECWAPGGPGGFLWLESPPDQVNPADLARDAVAAMQLKAVPIGIAPKAEAGKIGIVGMPVWMWSTSNDASVTGPITRTASAGAVSVSATATLVSTTWDMGDGQTVICGGSRALGTAYQASFGLKESPTCGYRYNSTGTYTVRATSNWQVNWAGAGQTGTINFTVSSTAQIQIGEIQVLTQ